MNYQALIEELLQFDYWKTDKEKEKKYFIEPHSLSWNF